MGEPAWLRDPRGPLARSTRQPQATRRLAAGDRHSIVMTRDPDACPLRRSFSAISSESSKPPGRTHSSSSRPSAGHRPRSSRPRTPSTSTASLLRRRERMAGTPSFSSPRATFRLRPSPGEPRPFRCDRCSRTARSRSSVTARSRSALRSSAPTDAGESDRRSARGTNDVTKGPTRSRPHTLNWFHDSNRTEMT
jgi:hypothetical protein